LLRRLRGRRPELLIHLTGHPRGAWLAKSLGCRYAVAPALANKGRWWRRAFTHHYKLPRATPRHTVEINLDALRRIGVQPARAARALCLVPGGSAEAAAHRWLETLALPRGAFVHVHASSRWLFKCWPAERYAELIDCCAAAGLPALLTAAPDTRELAMVADIAGRCRDAPANLAGKLSLKELAAVCRHARLFIGVDSAPMHIAAAMGTPVVALFGPSGEHEWHPWQVPHRVVALDWSCRPCGNDGCGGGKRSECLTELPVDAVWQAAQELLACTSR
jgi:heptosyltransferase-3